MKDDFVRPSKDWNITYIGNGEHLITLKDKSIAMDGSNIITEVGILEGHILRRIELKHTDSSKVESIDSLLITFQRRLEMLDSLLHDLFEETECTKSDKRVVFGSEYAYPSQFYRLTLNCATVGDLVYPEIYIELLPKLAEPTKPEVNICKESIEQLAEAIAEKMPTGIPDCGDC